MHRHNFHSRLCMFKDKIAEIQETSNPNGHWHLPSRRATVIRVDTCSSVLLLDYFHLPLKDPLVLKWLLVFTAVCQPSFLGLGTGSMFNSNNVINQVYLCHESCFEMYSSILSFGLQHCKAVHQVVYSTGYDWNASMVIENYKYFAGWHHFCASMQPFDVLSPNLSDLCPSLDEVTIANINISVTFAL